MEVGELLGGRYRLDDSIAAGGMGEVWRATDTVLGRTVAVKILRPDLSADNAQPLKAAPASNSLTASPAP